MRLRFLPCLLLAIACNGAIAEPDAGSSGGGAATGGGSNGAGGGSVSAGGGTTATGGGTTSTGGGTTGSGGGAMTPDAGPPNYYSTHLMLAFVQHSADLPGWVRSLKGAGYNHLWAHMDDYGQYYVTNLKNVLDAAQDAGLTVSPGTAGGMSPENVAQVVKDSYDHPALLRLDGKRVYLDYGHDKAQYAAAVDLLADAGYPRSSYLLLANALFPIQNGTGWVENATGTPADVAAVNHAFDIDPNIDGFVNFAVDKGSSNTTVFISRVINENNLTVQAARARGKRTMAGLSGFYASVQFTDLGFDGAAQLWQAILDGAARPELVTDITTNDYAELSYFSPPMNPATNGLFYVPLASASYVLGPTVRTPLTDHSGLQRFLRPWVDAYLAKAAQPSFGTDRIFAWYYLHPESAPTLTTLPSEVAAASASFTPAWWAGTGYVTGNYTVGGQNQVTGIKTNLSQQMGVIRMAAHLTAPAQLRINGTTSAMKPAGAAYFEVPQTLGTPAFAIIRNGNVVLSGNGKQPITNSVWPGGWNPLITEVP